MLKFFLVGLMASVSAVTIVAVSADDSTKKSASKQKKKKTVRRPMESSRQSGPDAKLKPLKRPSAQPSDVGEVADVIDEWIHEKLESEGIPASPVCSDSEFIRRATLDIIGRIPTRDRVKKFLADTRPDKRAELVDELLASEEFGRHFGTIWYHLLIEPNDDNRQLIHPSFGLWLAEQFNKDRGWDEIVFDILTASGSRDENPATVFWLSHVEGAQQRELKPAQIAGAATQRFLGTQYQCAECHDHPFTGFKQQDFWSIAAFFGKTEAERVNKKQTKNGAIPGVREAAPGIKPSIEIPDSNLKPSPPKLPESKRTSVVNKAASLRGEFASWCTSPSNRAFARATVNRMWGRFFGRGFVNPVDDFRKDNPASHPEALDALAGEFTKSGSDLKHLIRVICATETYQRSSDACSENAKDETLFSHMALKQPSTDVLYASLVTALGQEIARPNPNENQKNKRKSGFGETKGQFLKFFNTTFERDSSSEFTHGIPQVLKLMNGDHLLDGNQTLRTIVAEKGTPKQVIVELYLATLSRPPTDAETTWMLKLYESEKDPMMGYRAVQWVLLNSSEFMLIH